MSMHEQITAIGPDGVAQFGNGRVIAQFYAGKKIHGVASDKANRAIYMPVDMVKVFIPGEKDVPEYEATPHYQRKYPEEWAAYKAGMTARESGTALEAWLPDDPATVMNLNIIHVETVEQLANLHDSALANVPRGETLRQSARKFLGLGGNPEVDELKAQNASLMQRLAALEAAAVPPKRGPGRPPRVKPAENTGAPDHGPGL